MLATPILKYKELSYLQKYCARFRGHLELFQMIIGYFLVDLYSLMLLFCMLKC